MCQSFSHFFVIFKGWIKAYSADFHFPLLGETEDWRRLWESTYHQWCFVDKKYFGKVWRELLIYSYSKKKERQKTNQRKADRGGMEKMHGAQRPMQTGYDGHELLCLPAIHVLLHVSSGCYNECLIQNDQMSLILAHPKVGITIDKVLRSMDCALKTLNTWQLWCVKLARLAWSAWHSVANASNLHRLIPTAFIGQSTGKVAVGLHTFFFFFLGCSVMKF